MVLLEEKYQKFQSKTFLRLFTVIHVFAKPEF